MRAVALAWSADVATFAFAMLVIGIPVGQEVNPLMRTAYGLAGVAGVAGVKFAMFAVIVYVVSRASAGAARAGILAAYAIGLVGAAANIVAIARFVP